MYKDKIISDYKICKKQFIITVMAANCNTHIKNVFLYYSILVKYTPLTLITGIFKILDDR
ncbi:hypothetical protein C2G38_2108984 [Gigaspora rosea]|uniref:Uncharacterized protein n=1 Tax=Gigaspora rosea TaxID=44941 RepID=A0A397UPG3_9GLOM|nr:hypothetical protein C2G38_2108984 [Gigaspora rosea]